MIVYIDDFNRISRSEYENGAVFLVNAETKDAQMPRLQQFNIKPRVIDILLKQFLLLLEFLCEVAFLQVLLNVWMERKDAHDLSREVAGAGKPRFQALEERGRVALGLAHGGDDRFRTAYGRGGEELFTRGGNDALIRFRATLQRFVLGLCYRHGRTHRASIAETLPYAQFGGIGYG